MEVWRREAISLIDFVASVRFNEKFKLIIKIVFPSVIAFNFMKNLENV